MPAASDSSGSLPLPDGGDTAPHRDLLASVGIQRSISVVARRKGVAEADVPDVVQETLARALDLRLPADGEEARKYIHGIAKRVALELVRKKAYVGHEEYVDDGPDAEDGGDPPPASASAQPALFDDREVARKVVDAGQRRFPTTFSYFLQAQILGRSPETIANDQGVHPGHVRREIATMQRFVPDYGGKPAASAAAP